MATIDSYFKAVQLVEQPNGVKQLVATDKPRFEGKFLCHWKSPCSFKVDDLYTNEKYCNQKGEFVGR